MCIAIDVSNLTKVISVHVRAVQVLIMSFAKCVMATIHENKKVLCYM